MVLAKDDWELLARLGTEGAEAYGGRRYSSPRQEFRKKFWQHQFPGKLGCGNHCPQGQIDQERCRLTSIGSCLAALLTVLQAEIGMGRVKHLAAVSLHLHGSIAHDWEWFVDFRQIRAGISCYRHLHEQQQRDDKPDDRATMMNMHHGYCLCKLPEHPFGILLNLAM